MRKFIDKLYRSLTVLAIVGVLVACSDDDGESADTTNLRDFTISDFLVAGSSTQGGSYNTVVEALEKAGLMSALESGSFTLLAPSDDAFAAAGVDVDATDAADLAVLLNYHLISSVVTTEGLVGRITTVNGASISASGGVVNGIATATEQFGLSNGVVFQLDALLTPPAGNAGVVVGADANLSLANAAIAKAGISLTGTSNITVFAPDNDAMTAIGFDQAGIDATSAADLAMYMSYHIVAGDLFSSALADAEYATQLGALGTVPGLTVVVGDPVEVGGAEVTSANAPATNGVVHTIDGFLLPPATMLEGIGPEVSIYGGNEAILLDGFYAGLVAAGLDQTYFGDITETHTLWTPLFFNAANHPVAADLVAAIEAHIFEGDMNYLELATVGGTRVTSVGGDEYVVSQVGSAIYINGAARNAFGSTSAGGQNALYDGTIVTVNGDLTGLGLPSATITQQLDGDADYTLFSAALTAMGAVTTGDHTVFALSNTAFTAAFSYTTVAEVEGADVTEFDDLMNHVVPNFYFGQDLNTVPTLVAASGESLAFSLTAGTFGLGVLVDPSDATYIPEIVSYEIFTASNGVIHEIAELISF